MKNFLRGGRGLSFGKIYAHLLKYKNKVLNWGVFLQHGRNNAIDKLNLIPKNDSFNVCCLQLKIFPIDRNKISLQLLIIFCVLFTGLSAPPVRAQEARGLNKIQLLKVGDTVPEELWHLPLKVVNRPEGKEYIRLSDYEDKKLIILDFWSSWCSGCINKMPESAQLQQEFSDKIHIIYASSEKENKVKRVVENVPGKEYLEYVYEDSIFNKVFPHKLVPHVVWINNDREVVVISAGQELSSANIQGYIEEGRLKIQLKQDILDFDQNLALKDNLDKLGFTPLQAYTSCFSSAIPGIGSNSGVAKGVISHVNSNIFSLYRTALNLSAIHKNISIDTASALFRFTQSGKELYCYELSVKTDLSIRGLKEIMLTDLNRFFNCDVELKTNSGSPYYVLRDKSRKEEKDGYQ